MAGTKTKLDDEISLANYFAIDILENVFNNCLPTEEEIDHLEHELATHYEALIETQNIKCQTHALIISSNTIECNALSFMMTHFGFQVTCVTTKEKLLKHLQKTYQIIIISDQFKEVGFNVLVTYFHAVLLEGKPFLIYLGNEFAKEYKKIGFDACLNIPFLMSTLSSVLNKGGFTC